MQSSYFKYDTDNYLTTLQNSLDENALKILRIRTSHLFFINCACPKSCIPQMRWGIDFYQELIVIVVITLWELGHVQLKYEGDTWVFLEFHTHKQKNPIVFLEFCMKMIKTWKKCNLTLKPGCGCQFFLLQVQRTWKVAIDIVEF